MKDWAHAIRMSASLDDRRDRSDVPPAIARVDEALSRPGSVPRERAPATLHSRVLGAIADDAPAPLPGPWLWLRPALAASLLIGVGGGLAYFASRGPAVTPAPAPTARLDLDATYLTQLPTKAEPLTLAMSDPLVDEARLIGEDTRRAASVLLARLPTRLSR